MIKHLILPRYSLPFSKVEETGKSLGCARLQSGWTLRGARRAVKRYGSATGHYTLLADLFRMYGQGQPCVEVKREASGPYAEME